jgi:hypothetical protein
MIKKSIAAAAAICACTLYLAAIGAAPASASWTETCTNGQKTEQTFTWYNDSDCRTLNSLGPYHRVLNVPYMSIWTHIFLPATADSQVSATIGGVKLTVKCQGLTNSSGVAENIEELGVKKVKGKEMVMSYSKCSVIAPAEKGCKVAEPITTTKLKTTAAQVEKTQKVTFEPESGTKIATLSISSCSISGLNGEKELTGSIVGVVPATATEQSLIQFTSTSGSSLKLAGQTATYTGSTEAENEKTGELLFIGE